MSWMNLHISFLGVNLYYSNDCIAMGREGSAHHPRRFTCTLCTMKWKLDSGRARGILEGLIRRYAEELAEKPDYLYLLQWFW